MKKVYLLPGFILIVCINQCFSQRKIKLFEESDRNNWYVYLGKTGKDNDPLKVFQFDNGMLRASGEDFGYVITKEKYADFHLAFEFKWGVKKYPPRLDQKRDAGVLYHVDLYSGDKIWPRSLEFQVQEGDCGDFWMTDSTTIKNHNVLTSPKNWFNIKKEKDAEKPTGKWNKVEVIVSNGKITHLINGEVVVSAELGNTKEGQIVLQSEGAEIFYRNVEITRL